MRSFPLFLKLQDRPVLVVGDGAAAAAKVRLLASAGASLTIISQDPEPTLLDAIADTGANLVRRDFVARDVAHADVIIAASGIRSLDELVAKSARAARKIVNTVDRPELCDFTMPAVIDRDQVVVAVSTDGASPVLAQRVRAAIESVLPPGLGRLANFAGKFRSAVHARLKDNQARRFFWERIFGGPIGQAVLAGDETGAVRELIRQLNASREGSNAGQVFLVGAGPGDPELLTLRAARLLREADVIVYDRLVDPSVMEYARRDARRIFVGKAKGEHTLPQHEINELLIAEANAGRRVVRLKGGDPFIFGRGGEEMEALLAAGIRVEIVPGITAASGCAAYAGFPLTHRDHASSVVFISGHGKEGAPDLDWAAIAAKRQTVVVYMGVSSANDVAQKLMAAGLSGATPIAIIEKGTRWDQRVVKGELARISTLIQNHGIEGPALLVIGSVTRLAVQGQRAELRAAAE